MRDTIGTWKATDGETVKVQFVDGIGKDDKWAFFVYKNDRIKGTRKELESVQDFVNELAGKPVWTAR